MDRTEDGVMWAEGDNFCSDEDEGNDNF